MKKALSLTLALALSLAAPASADDWDDYNRWALSVPGKAEEEFVMPSAAFDRMMFDDEVGTIGWEKVVRLNAVLIFIHRDKIPPYH